MPSPIEAYEEVLQLQIGLLEALPPTSGSYPYPSLGITGQTESRPFRAAVLENAYLRLVVLPELGGRIISLFDKRTARESLPVRERLEPEAGGDRGAYLPDGIQICLSQGHRLNSMGPVHAAIHAGEESSAIWLGEFGAGQPYGLTARISLEAESAVARIECRMHNRGWDRLPYSGGFSLGFTGEEPSSEFWHDARMDIGLAWLPVDRGWEACSLEAGCVFANRFAMDAELSPRQVDAWSVELLPVTSLGGISAASRDLAAFLTPEALRLQAARRLPNHKVLILTKDGQTLEAPADLYPEHILELPLDGLPSELTELVVMSDRREEVLRFAAAGGGERSDLPKVAMRAEVLPPTQDEAALTRATFNVSTRHIAWTRLGMISLAQGDTAEAGERFEQALLYNADDPLLWWEAAAAARVAGRSGDEEPAELLNAHYLSPLEPALRAEAFLSQPVEPGKEPNPLVAPLDEAPESYIEVAAMLVEHGLLSDATRWIDEALRHADLAMLRILLAYCYLSGSRMAAEAASEIQKAEALGLPTPLPWRRVEIDALRAVGSRFPEAVGIRKWLELAERLATRTPRDT